MIGQAHRLAGMVHVDMRKLPAAAQEAGEIEVFHLPANSPELNPGLSPVRDRLLSGTANGRLSDSSHFRAEVASYRTRVAATAKPDHWRFRERR